GDERHSQVFALFDVVQHDASPLWTRRTRPAERNVRAARLAHNCIVTRRSMRMIGQLWDYLRKLFILKDLCQRRSLWVPCNAANNLKAHAAFKSFAILRLRAIVSTRSFGGLGGLCSFRRGQGCRTFPRLR